MRDPALEAGFAAARSHIQAALDELDGAGTAVDRGDLRGAVLRIAVELEMRLDQVDTDVIGIVERLEQLGGVHRSPA